MYTPTEKILRPKPDHDYDSMAGMKKTFLFMAVREGTILQRKFACWCSSCAQMSAPGEGEMDTSYRCVECETWKQAEAGKGEYLKWAETSIARTDPAGIANAKAIALAHSRSLRDQLLRKFEQSNEPVWVGVQNRGENVLSTHKLKPLKTLSLLPLCTDSLTATATCHWLVSGDAPICRIQINIGLARSCQSGRSTRPPAMLLAAKGECDMIRATSSSKFSGMTGTSVAARSGASSSGRQAWRTGRVHASVIEPLP